MIVKCDVCGREVEEEDAILRQVDEDVSYFCSPECAAKEEYVEADWGPVDDDDRRT